MLTKTEYLDPHRFPLTNRQDLTLENQHLIDSVNHDSLKELVDNGQQLNPRQQKIMAELAEKLANVPANQH